MELCKAYSVLQMNDCHGDTLFHRKEVKIMFSIYTSILFRQYKKRIADISGTDSQDIIEKIMDMTNKYERRIDTINNVIHIIQILCWFLCPLSSLFSNDLYALIALLGFLMFLADLAMVFIAKA